MLLEKEIIFFFFVNFFSPGKPACKPQQASRTGAVEALINKQWISTTQQKPKNPSKKGIKFWFKKISAGFGLDSLSSLHPFLYLSLSPPSNPRRLNLEAVRKDILPQWLESSWCGYFLCRFPCGCWVLRKAPIPLLQPMKPMKTSHDCWEWIGDKNCVKDGN